MVAIMQGDALNFPVNIVLKGDKVVPNMVSAIEMTLGSVTKTYPEDITYDSKSSMWLLPLTQEDTFSLNVDVQVLQVRVKFTDDTVIGTDNTRLKVLSSRSKKVL